MTGQQKSRMRDILSDLARRRGLFWQPYELYGGLRGTIAVGPNGSLIKRRIEDLWLDFFVEGFSLLALESPILGPRDVYVASGHEASFVDRAAKCSSCGAVWRIDQLLSEEYEVPNAELLGLDQLEQELISRDVTCPNCKGKLEKPFSAPLMIGANIGFAKEALAYLRPETAQGIFTEFKRLYKIGRQTLPMGVAQMGKVFRNEISPRHGLLRLREFTIMELEMFIDPSAAVPIPRGLEGVVLPILTESAQRAGSGGIAAVPLREAIEGGTFASAWLGIFMATTLRFIEALGIDGSKVRLREKLPQERAHYARQLFDAEVWLDGYDWTELAGFAYRTDYDLSGHAKTSGEDLSVTTGDGRKVVPHVVEPSFGAERVLYATLEHNLKERDGSFYLSLPPKVAPKDVSVFPLLNKAELCEVAEEVLELLRRAKYLTNYDESGSIGRRYARSDEIGIPLAVTVDYQTLKDRTVTVRDRDTRSQDRVRVDELPSKIGLKLSSST